MDYKKMIEEFAKNGGTEKTMWDSVAIMSDAMDYIKEHDEEKYECLMRKTHEAMYGKHYNEAFAKSDVEDMYSTGADGNKHHGFHWTVEQIEAATKDKSFPKGTTKWDLYVGYNASWHDLNKKFTDAQILDAAYLLWFNDEDWDTSGKIWDYMKMMNY